MIKCWSSNLKSTIAAKSNWKLQHVGTVSPSFDNRSPPCSPTINVVGIFFSYFDNLGMSTAKIFSLLFLSENFCCRQSQNIKVRKKSFAVTIPEYQSKKTKFCQK